MHSLRILLALALGLLAPLPAVAQATGSEPAIPAAANERITYIHTDALGSPILGTDAQGNVVWREEYQPYGERFLGAAANTRRLYTGQYEETRTGLIDFGGRWYHPEIGRFYSVDPQGFDETNPHSFNRYAYANNNPYRFIDPNGEAGLDIVKLVPAFGASLGGLAAYTQGVATGDAALTHAANAGLAAQMGANIEALASLVTPPGMTSQVILNAVGGVTPNAQQAANLNRFQKKVPSNSKDSIEFRELPNGGVAAQATSPGKVPGSKAVYEKQIDVNGQTIQATKTTYDPQGNIVHVKDKLNGETYP